MDEQKRLGLELALEDRLSDDLGQLTVRPYADYKRAALQRGEARSTGARRPFLFVGIGATVAIALLLAVGAASALWNRSSAPAASPTAIPAASTGWRDQLTADVRAIQPQLAFQPLIPSFVPVEMPARVGTRASCGVATTPCLEYSFPGLINVLEGPAGCCLDFARPDALRDIEIRPGVNAQFIPVQPQFGGPILWWLERTARGDVYVALSSPIYGPDELIRVARSMTVIEPTRSPVATPEDAVHAVLASPDVNSSMFAPFPTSVGSRACEVHGGGPAPGIVVPGTCRTEVEANGSSYLVKFIYVWDARRFHHAGEPSSGELQHVWSFTVDGAGTVVTLPESGNFPPTAVR